MALKSSFELAMARLDAKQGKTAPMSAAQKKAIAETDNRAKAKVAEVEILMGKSLAEARARGLPEEEVRKIEEQKQFEIAKIRSRAEDEKEQIRKGK